MTPTCSTTIKLATVMRRKLSTHWADPEIRAYKEGIKKGWFTPEELEQVLDYYAHNYKKEGNICRTSVLTLLRYWPIEVDRARDWKEKRAKPKRVVPDEPRTEDNFEAVGPMIANQLREWRIHQ